jgi:hypothetical protein
MYLAVSAMERLSRMRLNSRMGTNTMNDVSTPPVIWNNPSMDKHAATALAQRIVRLEVGR